ncbi:envelope stress response membrane protein PspC [Agarivorans aestuarii]|uniref:Envelope stress response membrane protein PspC n=1 Tax=Agarivorans aestuarii TaxID=1563703 RepID=A0ABU7G0N5_9ALTE|nr:MULTISPECIES: envelope stress response membrane protein PspC [Agarivorans]MEE1672982.1 envelope stress response membrane protein PspC [Agarivorans aestuarii]
MFDKPLYRDPQKGKIAGVCAGLAHSLGAETWLIRIIAVTLAITNLGLFFIIYGAAWLFMDKRPSNLKGDDGVTIKSKVWQRGETPSQAVGELEHQFDDFEQRLRKVEKVVTARDFELHSQFKNL